MCWTRRASKNARSTASTRATGCSTSTPTSASTAGLVSRCARSRRSSTRTTFRNSGRTTRRRTTSSSTTSGRRAAPPRLARSTRTTPWLWPTLDARVSTELTRVPSAGSSGLPDFPWDLLEPAKAVASAHPDGIVDLSMGTPVDPVPAVGQAALCAAADSPGYPLTAGSPALRSAISSWVSRWCAAAPGFAVLPTIGSKELVAWLPTLLGPAPVRLVWLSSPSNPTGQVLPPAHLRKVVDWARSRGAVVASDECYLTLGWESAPASILSVCDDGYDGVLAVHSLSKRTNLAGYRAGFVAGDASVVAELLAVRKHAGMMVPAPVQAAMVA